MVKIYQVGWPTFYMAEKNEVSTTNPVTREIFETCLPKHNESFEFLFQREDGGAECGQKKFFFHSIQANENKGLVSMGTSN